MSSWEWKALRWLNSGAGSKGKPYIFNKWFTAAFSIRLSSGGKKRRGKSLKNSVCIFDAPIFSDFYVLPSFAFLHNADQEMLHFRLWWLCLPRHFNRCRIKRQICVVHRRKRKTENDGKELWSVNMAFEFLKFYGKISKTELRLWPIVTPLNRGVKFLYGCGTS